MIVSKSKSAIMVHIQLQIKNNAQIELITVIFINYLKRIKIMDFYAGKRLNRCMRVS